MPPNEDLQAPHPGTRPVVSVLPAAVKLVIAALLAATLGLALPRNANAQAPGDISGRWATQGFGSIVEFRPCAGAETTMCGRILWLWESNDSSGRLRRDTHNPDRTQRTRSLIGIELVRGLRQTAPGVWTGGELYNPDDGRTYTGAIRVRNGALELRGCALGVFCQTQTWRRPDDVIASVRAAGL
jgi:uncharacterized protein (DUF2147 family)